MLRLRQQAEAEEAVAVHAGGCPNVEEHKHFCQGGQQLVEGRDLRGERWAVRQHSRGRSGRGERSEVRQYSRAS